LLGQDSGVKIEPTHHGEMKHSLMRLQISSLGLLRLLLWAVAVGYLLLEAREVASQRQLTQITVFAVLALVANFQINLTRSLNSDHPLTQPILQSGLAMFMASLFAMLDGASDHLLSALKQSLSQGILSVFILLGWMLNILSVSLALGSMELFLRCLRQLTLEMAIPPGRD
jgi:hypothetical protein